MGNTLIACPTATAASLLWNGDLEDVAVHAVAICQAMAPPSLVFHCGLHPPHDALADEEATPFYLDSGACSLGDAMRVGRHDWA